MILDLKPNISNDGVKFVALDVVNTQAATPSEKIYANIKYNSKRKLPRLFELEEFKKEKSESIALIGGGPSIKTQLDKIKEFNVKLACGSVHDYLSDREIICEYATACDPDPIMSNYFRNSNYYTKYLISTNCDPRVFDVLNNKQIYTWHCFGDEFIKLQPELEDYRAVGGGCTVGLRSLSIALMLGYTDIHFFGFDSCLSDTNHHHAYDFTDKSEQLGKLYEVRIGDNNSMNKEKLYLCAGYQVAQAKHYKDFYEKYSEYYCHTFHGEGLLQSLMKEVNNKEENYKIRHKWEHRALKSLISQPNGTLI